MGQVSFQWKNPDFLIRNPDFLFRNPDFLLKNVDFIIKQSKLLSRLLFNFPADAASIKSAYGEVPFRRVTYLSQLLQALCLRQESDH